VLLGVGVMAWAALELGRSLTPLPGPRATAALITSGPFAIARHPIYVGLALAVLGSSLWSGGLPQLAVAIGLGALLIVKSRYEESLLTARFPDYGVYAARVPAFGVRLPRR
jgi:protein-S-isoprenylcysteine O-methyltransferase Ste14